jgi:hypothetical protein
MKSFRYIELDEKPDSVVPKYKIGDLVQMVTFTDWSSYNWVSCGNIGLVMDLKFFVEESYDPSQSVKYVTEYKVSWIDSTDWAYLDESMLTLVRR